MEQSQLSLACVLASSVLPTASVYDAYHDFAGTGGRTSMVGQGFHQETYAQVPEQPADYAVCEVRAAVGLTAYVGGQYLPFDPSEVEAVWVRGMVGIFTATPPVFDGQELFAQRIELTPDMISSTGVISGVGTPVWEFRVGFSPAIVPAGQKFHLGLVPEVDYQPLSRISIVYPTNDGSLPYSSGWFHKFPEYGQAEAYGLLTQDSPTGFLAMEISTVPDLDGDSDTIVDTGDLSVVIACLQGPGVTTPPPGLEAEFALADLDNDGDVDLHDLRGWQLAFMGNVSP